MNRMIAFSTDNISDRPHDDPHANRGCEEITAEQFEVYRDGMRATLGFFPHEAVEAAIRLNICSRDEYQYHRAVERVMGRKGAE